MIKICLIMIVSVFAILCIPAVIFTLVDIWDDFINCIKNKIRKGKPTAKCTCANCWYWRHEEKFGEPLTGFCKEFGKYTEKDAFCSFGRRKRN